MESIKSLELVQLFTSLLLDVSVTLEQDVYTLRDARLDAQKAKKRIATEGVAFLTKQLPRLGRSLDRALTGDVSLDYTGFSKQADPSVKLPKFMGKLFVRVFSCDGWVLQTPCTNSVRLLRGVLFAFSKYALPNNPKLDEQVIAKFEKTEQDLLLHIDCRLCHLRVQSRSFDNIIYGARARLKVVLGDLDVRDILPRHGPGAVSTRETGAKKYRFSRYNERIANIWPWEEYFYASLGHVCDEMESFKALPVMDHSARVLLVPKDSRGPRLISCEPLENQWIQQGLGQVIVDRLQSHVMTKQHIHFRDQRPNRDAALLGSITGNTCTLDLAEASDRVSVGLVRQLFPMHLCDALLAARSLATTLPDGRDLKLRKYAPMGSALCFPVLAATVWAVLASGLDAKARKGLLVYGDDVIVCKTKVQDAINILESVGLKVNRNKSCTNGFFRESCGMDAFKGVDVTPVRIKTVWSSSPSAKVYVSYIAYANALYKRGFINAAYKIADSLLAVYKCVPTYLEDNPQYPALCFIHPDNKEPKTRINKFLQKKEIKVLVVVSKSNSETASGWEMLLRWFTEAKRAPKPGVDKLLDSKQTPNLPGPLDLVETFRVREYTQRGREKLRLRWR